MYCCQTCWAIAAAEELDFRVAGPEERVDGVEAAGAEVVVAACRLAGMVVGLERGQGFAKIYYQPAGIPVLNMGRTREFNGIRGRRERRWRGDEDRMMPAGSFVIAESRGGCSYRIDRSMAQASFILTK